MQIVFFLFFLFKVYLPNTQKHVISFIYSKSKIFIILQLMKAFNLFIAGYYKFKIFIFYRSIIYKE